MDESKVLIDLLANAKLKGFVDLKKLVASQAFSGMAEYAALHAVTHGDYGYIVKLLKLLAGSRYFYSAVGWFGMRAGLTYRDVQGLPTFSKSPTAPNSNIKIQDFIQAKPPRLNTSPKSTTGSVQTIITSKKVKKSPKRVDMLDARERLPGSFGSGKRR
jgi:hypothetical protein